MMFKVILFMLAFAIVHSWLAGKNIKQTIRLRIGERAYHGFFRLGYNMLAVLTLAPAFLIAVLNGGQVIWHVEGFAAFVLLGVQIVGVVGVLASLVQIDTWRFAGIRQAQAYISDGQLPLTDEPLQLKGVYGLVRHPLYLFSLMAIWPLATMNEGLLAFNIGATLYFIFGSLLEERRLTAAYGDVYRNYQESVPWLIPHIHH